MRVKRTIRVYLSLAILLLLNFSCKKDCDEVQPAFSKAVLLENVADNIILPALNDFESTLSSLESSFFNLQTNPNQENLNAVRANWKASYMQWQMVKIFDFGPIRNNGFKGAVGTYPTDTNQLNLNVINGGYNLSTADNADAIGFSALDFLLHRNDALTNLNSNESCMQYTLDVIQKMKNEFALVKSQWTTYRSIFIAGTGTESTSSFSLLVNEFNRDYELAKNGKLGVPIGAQTLGIQLPEYIEARNSGISLELLKESIRNLRIVFTGDNSSSGLGFYDYLVHLERSSLASTIDNNFSQIINKIETFNGSLETEMSSNVSSLNQLYNLIQSQVVNIKTDMTSAFGVLITYQDNDGD